MPWMACIPLMQEQLTVCSVLLDFSEKSLNGACRRPSERGVFEPQDVVNTESAGAHFRCCLLFADQKVRLVAFRRVESF